MLTAPVAGKMMQLPVSAPRLSKKYWPGDSRIPELEVNVTAPYRPGARFTIWFDGLTGLVVPDGNVTDQASGDSASPAGDRVPSFTAPFWSVMVPLLRTSPTVPPATVT